MKLLPFALVPIIMLHLSGCTSIQSHKASGTIIENWGPKYKDVVRDSPGSIKILGIEELSKIWASPFDTKAPNANGYGEDQDHSIVSFDGIRYAVSRPEYPPKQKSKSLWFDIYVKNPEGYGYEDNLMLTFFYDEGGYLRSIAMNGSRIDNKATKQIFVSGQSNRAAESVAQDVSRELGRIIEKDTRDYWGLMPSFMGKFILAVDESIKI